MSLLTDFPGAFSSMRSDSGPTAYSSGWLSDRPVKVLFPLDDPTCVELVAAFPLAYYYDIYNLSLREPGISSLASRLHSQM